MDFCKKEAELLTNEENIIIIEITFHIIGLKR
jgi:hypothetical protein